VGVIEIRKTCHGSHGCHAKGKNGHFWEIRAAMASHALKLATKWFSENWPFFPTTTTRLIPRPREKQSPSAVQKSLPVEPGVCLRITALTYVFYLSSMVSTSYSLVNLISSLCSHNGMPSLPDGLF
jgi:hypothetical protein